MKKIALLLVAAVMISGGAFAQDKTACKKGAGCTHSCCKDKKSNKAGAAKTSTSTTATKQAPQPKS